MITDRQTGEIEKLIGYSFNNKELIKTAFNHVSYANEHGGQSNETLEFLGDSVLNFIVADILYDKEFGDEGEMSVLRAKIVSRAPLAREVERLGLLPYLKLSSGFDLEQNMSQKFISNIYEAVLAAVYKDSGLARTKEFVKKTLLSHLETTPARDYKTKLQEAAQAQKLQVKYEDNQTSVNPPEFLSKVYVDGKLLGEGTGQRKKAAQQAAAKAAAAKLEKKNKTIVDGCKTIKTKPDKKTDKKDK